MSRCERGCSERVYIVLPCCGRLHGLNNGGTAPVKPVKCPRASCNIYWLITKRGTDYIVRRSTKSGGFTTPVPVLA